MNAFSYFGQQKIITTNDAASTITSQNGMDAITYGVAADPLAAEGV